MHHARRALHVCAATNALGRLIKRNIADMIDDDQAVLYKVGAATTVVGTASGKKSR